MSGMEYGLPGLPFSQAALAGRLAVTPSCRPGFYYASHTSYGGGGGGTVNRLLLCPIWLPAGTFDRINCRVVTGVATALLRLGVYADSGGGFPGALVLDAGTVDASSAAVKEITISLTIPAGLYWIGGVAQTATPTTVINNTTTVVPYPMGSGSTADSPGIVYYYDIAAGGGLPARFARPTVSQVLTAGLRVLLRTA